LQSIEDGSNVAYTPPKRVLKLFENKCSFIRLFYSFVNFCVIFSMQFVIYVQSVQNTMAVISIKITLKYI